MMRGVHRIGVFRARRLGDMLTAVPALRALRMGFPRAEITLIGLPWAAEFAARFGRYVDRFVPFAGYPGLDDMPCRPERTERFLQEQRAHGYDLAIQMHGSGAAANALIADLGAWVCAGYFLGDAPDRLTVAAPWPATQPEVTRMIDLARLVGCPDAGLELEFPLFFQDHREAAHLLERLPADGPRIGLHLRRAPAEQLATVADELVRRHDASILLLGTERDRDAIQAVLDHMELDAANLAGRTSLGGLGAVLRRTRLFIGDDSGPARMAHAVQTPSITIASSPDAAGSAPMPTGVRDIVMEQVPADLCGRPGCAIHRLSADLRTERVLPMAEDLLTHAGEETLALAGPPVPAVQPGPVGWVPFSG
jgi:ADP-heptose:LPS heptosyltransferase